ncbi:MAG: S8 family serine peptidase [Silvanigrellales bacterium]|nr:S8 family serine peptidase [Silvanigrellales bacterium]
MPTPRQSDDDGGTSVQGLENNPKPPQKTKSLPLGLRALLALGAGGMIAAAFLPEAKEPKKPGFPGIANSTFSTFAAKAMSERGARANTQSSLRRLPARPRGVILRRSAHASTEEASEFAGSLLFVADDGATYTFRDDLSLSDARSRFGQGWTVFENARGFLQSLPQRTLDPSVSLQWHNFSWPSLLLDRFPLSLDQSTPGLRMRRVDEFLFWMPRDFLPDSLPQDTAMSACPAHQPSSMHVNRLWGYFDDDALLGGTVLLQDGSVDRSHADLGEQGKRISSRSKESTAEKSNVEKSNVEKRPSSLLSAHGTHVAGVMAARRNDFGVTGVAPGLEVEVFPLKEGDGFSVELADVLAGLSSIEKRLAESSSGSRAARKAPRSAPRTVLLSALFEDDVVHLTTRGTPLRDALESLLKHDVAVVVPAGNGTPVSRLAATLPSALTPFLEGRKGILVPVAASDLCSGRAWFSRVAPLASGTLLFAPGERIFSTLPNGDYGYLSGSSQAAAQVAAVLALGAHFAPNVPVRSLVESLVRTAQPLPHVAARAFMPDAWSFLVEIEQKK